MSRDQRTLRFKEMFRESDSAPRNQQSVEAVQPARSAYSPAQDGSFRPLFGFKGESEGDFQPVRFVPLRHRRREVSPRDASKFSYGNQIQYLTEQCCGCILRRRKLPDFREPQRRSTDKSASCFCFSNWQKRCDQHVRMKKDERPESHASFSQSIIESLPANRRSARENDRRREDRSTCQT